MTRQLFVVLVFVQLFCAFASLKCSTATTLNVRSGPSTSYSVSFTVRQGDALDVVSYEGGWAKLKDGNYVSSSYLSSCSSSKRCTTANLNVRKSPSASGPKLTTLNQGASVDVYSVSGSWACIGYRQYVHDGYLGSCGGPGPQPPTPGKFPGDVSRRGSWIEVMHVMVQSQFDPDPFSSKSNYCGAYCGGYCGIVSMQNVLALYGVKKDRDTIANGVPGCAVYQKGVGSVHACLQKFAKAQGFSKTSLTYPSKSDGISKIATAISAGRPQIINVKGLIRYIGSSQTYNTNGHLMVLSGVNMQGGQVKSFRVIDSNGRKGGLREMDVEVFRQVWSGMLVDVNK